MLYEVITLGGEHEIFNSRLAFELRGTGALAGFHRVVTLEAAVETHTAPRTPGDKTSGSWGACCRPLCGDPRRFIRSMDYSSSGEKRVEQDGCCCRE